MKKLLSIILVLFSLVSFGQFQVPNARMWMYDNAEQLPLYSWGINPQQGYTQATGGTQNPPNQDPRASVTVTTAYARKGTKSYKMYVEKRTDYPGCCEWTRSEWVWLNGGQQTLAYEWGWAGVSILIDPSFQFENRPTQIAFDTKAVPDYPEATPFWLGIINGQYYVEGEFIPRTMLGPVIKGVWEDWLVHRNFKADNTGFLYFYRNGQIVFSWVDKPNWFNKPGYAPIARLQHGLYKWVWATSNGQGWGEGSPLAAANAPMTIYLDEIRVGKPNATLQDMLVDAGGGNSLPTANAGADKFITLPITNTSLVGTGTDTDGTITGYLWTQSASNPVAATIGSPTASTTGISGLTVAGTYAFTLRVTDNTGAQATDNVLVTVNPASTPNAPPSAYAGNNVIITLPENSVTMPTSGAGAVTATDPEGLATTVLWTLLHGTATLTNANALGVTISGMTADYYTLRLTVTDNVGQTATDTVNVTVLPEPVPPNPPVAIVGPNQTIILPLDSIYADGTQSYCLGDSIVAYNWSKVSGPSGFSVRTQGNPQSVIYDLDEGTYVIRLITIAGNTKQDTAQFTVVVQPVPISNLPPEIDSMPLQIINLPTVTTPGSTTLSVSATDPDGSITSYVWQQVSGPIGAILGTPNASSTPLLNLVTGTYVFSVTVYDDRQLSSTATVTIYVRQPLRRGSFFVRFRKRFS